MNSPISNMSKKEYIIKQIPDDFIVEEIFNPKLNKGEYLYVKLKKVGVDTFSALNLISNKLHVKHNDIGIAGSKDKNAITTQLISLKHVSEERISNLHLDKIQMDILGHSDKPISLGDHEGNKFMITIRQIDDYKDIITKLQKMVKKLSHS